MTSVATSVVSIEREQNVVFLTFGPAATPPAAGPDDSRWPDAVGEELAPATGPVRRVPARWSPRPVRVLSRRFARSEFAADLRDWGWLVGLLTAGVVLMAAGDHLHPLAHLIGGTR